MDVMSSVRHVLHDIGVPILVLEKRISFAEIGQAIEDIVTMFVCLGHHSLNLTASLFEGGLIQIVGTWLVNCSIHKGWARSHTPYNIRAKYRPHGYTTHKPNKPPFLSLSF